jgi:hypothetical protein
MILVPAKVVVKYGTGSVNVWGPSVGEADGDGVDPGPSVTSLALSSAVGGSVASGTITAVGVANGASTEGDGVGFGVGLLIGLCEGNLVGPGEGGGVSLGVGCGVGLAVVGLNVGDDVVGAEVSWKKLTGATPGKVAPIVSFNFRNNNGVSWSWSWSTYLVLRTSPANADDVVTSKASKNTQLGRTMLLGDNRRLAPLSSGEGVLTVITIAVDTAELFKSSCL